MIGQMNVKMRNEGSYHGVPVAVLKSGLQKYVRRGLLDKGLWCLVELDLFGRLENNRDAVTEYLRRHGLPEGRRGHVARKAAALRTNLANRLLVMVPEEVSISTYWLPLVVDRLYEGWKAERDRPDSGKYLVDIYKYLTRARKARLISDLKSVYLLPPDYVKPHRRAGLRALHADLLQSLGLSHLREDGRDVPEDLVAACPLDLRPWLGTGDEELRRVANGVLYHLKYKSDRTFYWVNRLIERQRDPEGECRFGRKKDPLNLVWRLLRGFEEMREGLWNEPAKPYPDGFGRVGEVIAVLQKWFESMTHRERPCYLYHALLLVVRRDEIDWGPEVPAVDTPREEVAALYRDHLSGGPRELDDFVYDVHTGQRQAGGRARFAREGAWVANEDLALRNAQYRQLYHALKERLDVYEAEGRTGARKARGGER